MLYIKYIRQPNISQKSLQWVSTRDVYFRFITLRIVKFCHQRHFLVFEKERTTYEYWMRNAMKKHDKVKEAKEKYAP